LVETGGMAEHPTLRSVEGMTPEDQAALARAVQSLGWGAARIIETPG
jgi:hypothetical protein